MFTFQYAILSYQPDRARQERVNVGLVVFLGDRLDVRMLNSVNKVRALGVDVRPEDFAYMASALSTYVDFSETVEKQHQIIATFSSELVVSDELSWFRLESPPQYESVIERLFERFVVPPCLPPNRSRSGSLHKELATHFKKINLLGDDSRDIHRHLIVPRFPVVEEENLYADFALKNGAFHITKLMDYQSGELNSKFHQSATSAVTLDQAKRRFGSGTVCYFLYRADHERERQARAHIGLVSDYADQVLNLNSESDKAVYLSKITSAASSSLDLAI